MPWRGRRSAVKWRPRWRAPVNRNQLGELPGLTRRRPTGDLVYGHQAYRNSVVYEPSHLLAWCRLDELNTNSCRALLDKSQHPGSAP